MSFKLVGGAACLDFANTVAWRGTRTPEDRIQSYADLLAWTDAAGLLTNADRRRLRRSWERHRRRQAVIDRAKRLREAIFGVFVAVARRRAPAPEDLAVLNDEIAVAFAQLRISGTKRRFSWTWSDDDVALDRVLWPIAKSAADLLISGAADRVRQCESQDGCGWLFLDTSRNRSRRWCDMRDCGNRVKVRRYYQRRRKADRAEPSHRRSATDGSRRLARRAGG